MEDSCPSTIRQLVATNKYAVGEHDSERLEERGIRMTGGRRTGGRRTSRREMRRLTRP